MKVKTLRRHSYGHKIRVPGEIYEIDKSKDVQVLEAVKRVERVPEILKAPAAKAKQKEQKAKRNYNRKDLTAKTPNQIENRTSEVIDDGTGTDKV